MLSIHLLLIISYCNSPLGNSCGVTSSLKNSCAMLGCSASESASVNQNWRVLCSWVCFPVCALTRNTLNCRQSWAGLTSPFVTVRICRVIAVCQMSSINWGYIEMYTCYSLFVDNNSFMVTASNMNIVFISILRRRLQGLPFYYQCSSIRSLAFRGHYNVFCLQ